MEAKKSQNLHLMLTLDLKNNLQLLPSVLDFPAVLLDIQQVSHHLFIFSGRFQLEFLKLVDFVVETNGETGALGFSVAGPSQAEIECIDNGDGSALVKYHPTAPGEYAVHILCDEEDIPKSPFIAQILTLPKSGFNPDNVKVYGKGVEPNGVIVNEPTEFTVDTSKAGLEAPLDVKIWDSLGKKVQAHINHKSEHLKTVTYTATSAKPHSVEGM
jgi:filamin